MQVPADISQGILRRGLYPQATLATDIHPHTHVHNWTRKAGGGGRTRLAPVGAYVNEVRYRARMLLAMNPPNSLQDPMLAFNYLKYEKRSDYKKSARSYKTTRFEGKV